MDWSCSLRQATDETAWTIFIVGIVFDNLTVGNRLLDFMYSNLTQNGLVNSVLGELKLIAGNFATNFFNQY
jgi:hypothetical protein